MSHLRRRRNPQSLNPYSYARNNPLKYTDPSGHSALAALASAIIDWGLDAIEAGVGLFMKYSPSSSEETKKKGNDIINGILGSYVTEWSTTGGAGIILPVDNAVRYSKYGDDIADDVGKVAGDVNKNTGKMTSNAGVWVKESFEKMDVWTNKNLINPNQIDPKTGKTNLELMQAGNSPYGEDGKYVIIHHIKQTMDGGWAMISDSYHRINTDILHPNKTNSQINRGVFNSQKTRFWKSFTDKFK